jgi:hypothetical protein
VSSETDNKQYLLSYDAFVVRPGVCHVIVNAALEPPKVLVGELDDNPSTSATNAIETVANAISHYLLARRKDFELFQYVPRDLPNQKPAFYRIEWKGGRPFRWPIWNAIDPKEDDWLLGVQRYVRDDGYTSDSINAEPLDATTRKSP